MRRQNKLRSNQNELRPNQGRYQLVDLLVIRHITYGVLQDVVYLGTYVHIVM